MLPYHRLVPLPDLDSWDMQTPLLPGRSERQPANASSELLTEPQSFYSICSRTHSVATFPEMNPELALTSYVSRPSIQSGCFPSDERLFPTNGGLFSQTAQQLPDVTPLWTSEQPLLDIDILSSGVIQHDTGGFPQADDCVHPGQILPLSEPSSPKDRDETLADHSQYSSHNEKRMTVYPFETCGQPCDHHSSETIKPVASQGDDGGNDWLMLSDTEKQPESEDEDSDPSYSSDTFDRDDDSDDPDWSSRRQPRRSAKKQTTSNSPGVIRCTNCGTSNTPSWRRNTEGDPLCNACGLFLKLHGTLRPLSLKTDVIKRRNRKSLRRGKTSVSKRASTSKGRLQSKK